MASLVSISFTRVIAHSNLLRIYNSQIKCYSTTKINNNDKSLIAKDLSKVRNVGILAHIDAGKTTTTECMLYHAGITSSIGNIDEGNTVMDYLEQERARGITINAASISFNWKDYRLNLIDTPGHIDFNFEVKRCLQVLDGVVLLIDGTEGVQSQTIAVEKQTNKFYVPKIIFINKMERVNTNFEASLISIREKLNLIPLVCHYPLLKNGILHGVVDLINFKATLRKQETPRDKLSFDLNEPNKELMAKLDISNEILDMLKSKRNYLIEEITTQNEDLLEAYLNGNKLSTDQLISGLRKITCSGKFVPVFLGSALKNLGVDLLLDAIVRYLPSPLDRKDTCFPANFAHDPNASLIAYAFKVIYDKIRGPLVYFRIFSGMLRTHTHVICVDSGEKERINRLLLMLGDTPQEMTVIGPGNIGVAVGLKSIKTGDLITDNRDVIKILQKQIEMCGDLVKSGAATPSDAWLYNLSELIIPEPVISSTLYSYSRDEDRQLLDALKQITMEDPSLRYKYDNNTEEIFVLGMGDLHLQILKERLKKEFKLDIKVGKFRVAYHEVPTVESSNMYNIQKSVIGKEQNAEVGVSVYPSSNAGTLRKMSINLPSEQYISNDLTKVVLQAFKTVCNGGGPLGKGPVIDLEVVLTHFTLQSGTTPNVISAAARACLEEALIKSNVRLCEPIMYVKLSVLEEYISKVISDIVSSRRGNVLNIAREDNFSTIEAEIPLEHLLDYSGVVRSLTSGHVEYSSKFNCYRKLSQEYQTEIINQEKHNY